MKKIDAAVEEQDLVGMRLKQRTPNARIAGYMRHKGVEYKILVDQYGRASRLCRLRGSPSFYMVGRKGDIIWSQYGAAPSSVPIYDAA